MRTKTKTGETTNKTKNAATQEEIALWWFSVDVEKRKQDYTKEELEVRFNVKLSYACPWIFSRIVDVKNLADEHEYGWFSEWCVLENILRKYGLNEKSMKRFYDFNLIDAYVVEAGGRKCVIVNAKLRKSGEKVTRVWCDRGWWNSLSPDGNMVCDGDSCIKIERVLEYIDPEKAPVIVY